MSRIRCRDCRRYLPAEGACPTDDIDVLARVHDQNRLHTCSYFETNKSLELVLKPIWYDMIESGEKPEEYREITPHWRVRICRDAHSCQMREVCKANIYCHYEGGVPLKWDTVTLRRAYTKTVMKFEIDKIVIGFGKEEWGAKPGVKYYVIKLGKRIA